MYVPRQWALFVAPWIGESFKVGTVAGERPPEAINIQRGEDVNRYVLFDTIEGSSHAHYIPEPVVYPPDSALSADS